MKNVVGVIFNDSRKIYYFDIANFNPKKGDFVIVDTENGSQFGDVVTDIMEVDENKLFSPLKSIIKIADTDDINVNKKNIADAGKALEDAVKIADSLNLNMKIFSSSFTFDRKQLFFNFMADDRVDFRELARKLASIYKTRIELRQIGVRDKSKIIGGYGQCGKTLCCSSFLKDISSVSINMAKNQNLALNPQKINGVCGRLMCCLSFENECYNEYKKGLPKVGEKMLYNGENCKVIFVDLFNRSYKLESVDGKIFDVSE